MENKEVRESGWLMTTLSGHAVTHLGGSDANNILALPGSPYYSPFQIHVDINDADGWAIFPCIYNSGDSQVIPHRAIYRRPVYEYNGIVMAKEVSARRVARMELESAIMRGEHHFSLRKSAGWMASMRKWVFEGMNFQRADFGTTNLEGTIWQAVDLTDADFRMSYMERAIFVDCNMFGVTMYETWLRNATFVRCLFGNTKFDRTELLNTNFVDCYGLDKCESLNSAVAIITRPHDDQPNENPS